MGNTNTDLVITSSTRGAVVGNTESVTSTEIQTETAIQNLIDTAVETYLSVIYKLRNLE